MNQEHVVSSPVPGTNLVVVRRREGGRTTVTAEVRRTPLVAVNLAIPLGAAISAESVRDVYAGCLKRGPAGTTPMSWQERLRRCGATMRVRVRDTSVLVTLVALAEYSADLAKLIGGLCAAPGLSDDAVGTAVHADRTRGRLRGAAPAVEGRRLVRALLTGLQDDGPVDDLAERLRTAHRELAWGDTRLAVVGAGAEAVAADVLAALPVAASRQRHAAVPVRMGSAGVHRVPGSPTEAQITCGGLVPHRHESGYAAAEIAVTLLGGFHQSRLFTRLRQELGLSYGPTTTIEHGHRGSWFTLSLHTPAETSDSAMSTIEQTFAELAHETLPAQVVAAAGSYVGGTLRSSLATITGLASALGALLPEPGPEFIARHLRALALATPDDVRSVGATIFAPDRLVKVIGHGVERPTRRRPS